jgi:hypothetical protein
MTERTAQLPLAAVRFSHALTVGFTAFAYVTTQVRAVRTGSPWQDDPYDAVVSFTMFLAPALTALTALRALLCRGGRPQPVHRIEQLLRAVCLSTVLVAATTAADCVAAALHADHDRWTGDTPWLIAALVPLSVAAAVGLLLQWHAFAGLPRRERQRSADGDWLADLALLAELLTARLRGPAVRLSPGAVAAFARQRITAVAAIASLTAGLGLAVGQAMGEGVASPLLFVIKVSIASGGFFAFCMLCNAVLRIAAPAADRRWRRAARRGVVAAALALPVTTGMRDVLRPVVGRVDTVGQLAGLLYGAAALAGVLVFAVNLGRWKAR